MIAPTKKLSQEVLTERGACFQNYGTTSYFVMARLAIIRKRILPYSDNAHGFSSGVLQLILSVRLYSTYRRRGALDSLVLRDGNVLSFKEGPQMQIRRRWMEFTF
jgi:hypothetical protein